MELTVCINCGKMFNTKDKKICPLCMKKEDEYFELVRKYLKENPGVRLGQVAEETGVSGGLMRKWLREGRLKVTNTEGIDLKCEGCGKSILQGRYCVRCRDNMQNSMKNLYKTESKPVEKDKNNNTRMRFLDND